MQMAQHLHDFVIVQSAVAFPLQQKQHVKIQYRL